jgi:hypothetical protein
MYPDAAEVVAEARLEERAGGRVQRLAGRAQDVVDDRGNFGRVKIAARLALH